MKHIKKEYLAILLALAIGWIVRDLVQTENLSLPVFPQAQAESTVVLDKTDKHVKIATSSNDGQTVTIWVFSVPSGGNVLAMPGLVSSKVFTAR